MSAPQKKSSFRNLPVQWSVQENEQGCELNATGKGFTVKLYKNETSVLKESGNKVSSFYDGIQDKIWYYNAVQAMWDYKNCFIKKMIQQGRFNVDLSGLFSECLENLYGTRLQSISYSEQGLTGLKKEARLIQSFVRKNMPTWQSCHYPQVSIKKFTKNDK